MLLSSLDSLSILNDIGIEILPSNAVINYFDSNPTSPFHIRCMGTAENRNLQWESRNVSILNDGEVTLQESLEVPGLHIQYVTDLRSFFFNRSTIVLGIPVFSSSFTGYYTCRSRESNASMEVYMTSINPLWQLTSPLKMVVPMGAEVNLTLQYGDSSAGFRNYGNGFMYTLQFLPCVATLPDTVLQNGISDALSNILLYSFRARLFSDSGEFRWTGMFLLLWKLHTFIVISILATHVDSGNQYLASSNISVIRPHLVEFDTTVYALPDAIVTLRCLPNDTRAPILWQQQ